MAKIIKGPGKFDLMVSLFDGREIEFTLETGKTVRVILRQVEVESGNKDLHSWNLQAVVPAEQYRRVKMYYSDRGHGLYNG